MVALFVVWHIPKSVDAATGKAYPGCSATSVALQAASKGAHAVLRVLATATASPAPDLNVVRLWIHSGVCSGHLLQACQLSLESLLFCLGFLL